VLSAIAPSTLDFGDRLFSSWQLLRGYVVGKQPLGLRDPNPLDLIAVLQPGAFGRRWFDPITQTFYWEVYDEMGRALMLTLPFRDWTSEAIRMLEELDPPQEVGWRFVARLASQDDELIVEPISILRPENSSHPVFQLAFDSLPRQRDEKVSERISESTVEEEAFQTEEQESAQEVEPDLPARATLTGVITELNKRLEAIAETGFQKGLTLQRDWFTRSGREVYGFGLVALARALELLSQQAPTPGMVLKARYLTHLHSQAVTHLR
jgi:hypothetical protein